MAAHAPIDIATLKDDLSIADATNDAWLQRRVDGVWARIEAYTSRKLLAPPEAFVDDWSDIPWTTGHQAQPPTLRYWPSGSPFISSGERLAGRPSRRRMILPARSGRLPRRLRC